MVISVMSQINSMAAPMSEVCFQQRSQLKGCAKKLNFGLT